MLSACFGPRLMRSIKAFSYASELYVATGSFSWRTSVIKGVTKCERHGPIEQCIDGKYSTLTIWIWLRSDNNCRNTAYRDIAIIMASDRHCV